MNLFVHKGFFVHFKLLSLSLIQSFCLAIAILHLTQLIRLNAHSFSPGSAVVLGTVSKLCMKSAVP